MPTPEDVDEELLETEAGAGRPAGHDPYLALRSGNYRCFAAGSIMSVTGQQMLGVAVGWQLYQLTDSATALGLVGFVQVLPVVLLTLPAGQLADRVSRKGILLATSLLMGVWALALAAVSYRHDLVTDLPLLQHTNELLRRTAVLWGEPHATFADPAIPLVYGLLLMMGLTRALYAPARAALLPQIVPLASFSNAVAWHTSGFHIASVVGPAVGGLVLGRLGGAATGYGVVYALTAVCSLGQFLLVLPIIPRPGPRPAGRVTLEALAAGVRFVWQTRIILATITLDLFAVLLGGATALLPMFAKDQLNVGAVGLGWMRAAPAIGAFVMALLVAHLPPMKRAGRAMLWSVAGFGVATVVFGLSQNFWLSLVALALTGAFDNVSVVVRHTLVQVLTPDEMRGRVSAVNFIFIGLSNEMGALESGLTAALFGPVASVVGGGIGTLLVVLAGAWRWPEVRRFGALDSAGKER